MTNGARHHVRAGEFHPHAPVIDKSQQRLKSGMRYGMRYGNRLQKFADVFNHQGAGQRHGLRFTRFKIAPVHLKLNMPAKVGQLRRHRFD
jgi:hypothetical protein